MTARGCGSRDFKEVCEFLRRTICLAKDVKRPGENLNSFKKDVDEAFDGNDSRVIQLREDVTQFANGFDFFYENQLN